MPGDKDHAIADQFAGQCHRLIGVAEVIADDQLDALPEHAALRVDIVDRQLRGALVLLAEPGKDRSWRSPWQFGSRPPPRARRVPQSKGDRRIAIFGES